jgi:hypothetical protein
LGIKEVQKAELGSGVSIKYKTDENIYKGLIVLNLYKRSDRRYAALFGKHDSGETLVVAMNLKENKFIIIQHKDLQKINNFSFDFVAKNAKYREFMTEKREDFINSLLAMLNFSCDYKGNNLYRINQSIKSKDSAIKGDQSEIFICDMIKKFDEIEYVERIGQTNDKLDIIYKFAK